MKTNPDRGRLFRRSKAAGLLVLLFLLFHPLPAAATIRSDWTKVQAVPLGTPTTVVLYKDQAPPGKRKIKGHFRSATTGAITLLLPDGQINTFQKRAVRKVLIPRPFEKRYQGWITLAAASGVTQMLVNIDGASLDQAAVAHASLTLPVTIIAFLVAPKRGAIYNVPFKHRDHAKTKTAPSPQHSSKTVPEVTGTGESPTGSRVGDLFPSKESGPELLRWQARRALMRQGVPLQLPDPGSDHGKMLLGH